MKDGRYQKGDIVQPQHQMRSLAAGKHCRVAHVYKDGFVKLEDTVSPPRFSDRNSRTVFDPRQVVLITDVSEVEAE